MGTESAPTDSIAVDGGRKFGAPPIRAAMGVVIQAAIGAGVFIATTNRGIVPSCGRGEAIAPGETCISVRVRSGGVTTYTYEEVVAQAELVYHVFRVCGIILMSLALLDGFLLYRKWRRDSIVKSQLAEPKFPVISTHSRGVAMSLTMTIVGMIAIVGTFIFIWMAVMPGDGPVKVYLYVAAAIFGMIGIGAMLGGRPSHGSYIQTMDSGIRIADDGQDLKEVPWADVDYVIAPQPKVADHNLVVGGTGISVNMESYIDAETLKRVVLENSARAQVSSAIDRINRGESAGFGEIQLSLQGITVNEATLPWQEYRGIALKSGVLFAGKNPGIFRKINLAQVVNYQAMMVVIDAIITQIDR